MKYAVNYHTSFKHFDVVDEVIIEYSNDKQRAALLEFMQNKVRDDLRVIIAAEKLEDILPKDIDTFRAVQEIHPNFSVRIGLNHKHMMVDFVDNDIPYFYDVFVDSWDMLNGMIKYGVSDVYIVNEFAFYLPQIKKNCGDEVKIRVFPNVSQSTDKLHVLPTVTSFFIRPEDIPFYEEYIDVCEFFGTVDRNEVLYKIYTSGKWLGNLKELIIGLKEDIPNASIVPYFGQRRAICKKSCVNGNCNLCDQIVQLANSLQENGLEVKHD